MTTLISFLGRGRYGKGGREYIETNYQFDDGHIFDKQKYIGLALQEKLQPTKMILLGTAGSMWDVFLEQSIDGREEQWLALSDAVQSQTVIAEQLKPFESYLSEKLGIEIYCILIPFAKDAQEQIGILSVLSDILQEKEKVILDVTHGFRHLPMLALVAARFLKTIKQIDVQHIYYGAFEMKMADKTPVLTLDSLLQLLDWIDALTTFDKDGDYGQFSPLLIQEGLDENSVDLLKQAAFFERTTNSSQARQKLSTVQNEIEVLDSPIFGLFKQQLLKRLQWFRKANRGLQEQQLAREYLERGDYLRAVIYAMEGMISKSTLSENKDVNRYDDRESVRQALKENDSFRLFTQIRNALAHGLGRDVKQDIKRILNDEQKMQQSLKDRLKHLLDK